MSDMSKATTVDLDDDLHHALHLKSDGTRESMSELINDAVRGLLAEDLHDINLNERPVRDAQKEPRDHIIAAFEEANTNPAEREKFMALLDSVLTPERTPYEEFLKQLEANGTLYS